MTKISDDFMGAQYIEEAVRRFREVREAESCSLNMILANSMAECAEIGAQLRIRMPSNYVKSDGPGLGVHDVDPYGNAQRAIDAQERVSVLLTHDEAARAWIDAKKRLYLPDFCEVHDTPPESNVPCIYGVDPAKPGSDQTVVVEVQPHKAKQVIERPGFQPWPLFYDATKDETRCATQADIDRLVRSNEQYRKLFDLHAQEVCTLRQIIEAQNDGKPLWFTKPVKGDVVSGHQWDGARWQKLQLVKPSPEIDRIWDAVKDASAR